MESSAPIFIILLIAGAIVVGILVWQHEKKRRDALAALGAELGWHFNPHHDSLHDEEYAHFEIFRRGHSRVAYNTLTGGLEIAGRAFPAKMGDFRYKVTSSNGKTTTTTTYRFSYLILHLPFRRMPDLLIRPEHIFDKLAGVFGFDDIDFESAEFSRRFHVKCAHKKFAYDVVHPRMMEFLLATRPPCIDIEQNRCCLSDGSRRWTPEQFRQWLWWAEKFLGQWPEYLVSQHDERSAIS